MNAWRQSSVMGWGQNVMEVWRRGGGAKVVGGREEWRGVVGGANVVSDSKLHKNCPSRHVFSSSQPFSQLIT